MAHCTRAAARRYIAGAPVAAGYLLSVTAGSSALSVDSFVLPRHHEEKLNLKTEVDLVDADERLEHDRRRDLSERNWWSFGALLGGHMLHAV